jgi:DNA-binding response OmpR family regulator
MSTPARTHTVLVYSDDPKLRDAVRLAVGPRPADDLGRVEYVDCATGADVLKAVDAGGIDVVVLDGEARPTGGLGLGKQLKDEIDDCPPTLVLVARKDDSWLAKWSLADAVLPLPVDPFAMVDAVAELLRHREAALPVRRAAAV